MTAAAQKLAERCLHSRLKETDSESVSTDRGAGQPFNLTDALAAFTLEVVGSTAFGCGFNGLISPTQDVFTEAATCSLSMHGLLG